MRTLIAAVVAALISVSGPSFAGPLIGKPFKVICEKLTSPGQVDFDCVGIKGGKATGRVKEGDPRYSHWAGKPNRFTCLAGFGVPGPFSTGSISC